MEKNFLLLVLQLLFITGFSQDLQNNNWIIDNNVPGINFGGTNISTFPFPTTPTSPPVSSTPSYYEGSATLSDSNGNLLLFTDGQRLWRNNPGATATLITSALLGDSSSTQNVIFIPRPGNPNRYYVVTINGLTGEETEVPSRRGLRFSEVDIATNTMISLNTNLTTGAIFDVNQNQFPPMTIDAAFGNASESITSSKHSNGKDYWLVAHVQNDVRGVLLSFQVSCNGIIPKKAEVLTLENSAMAHFLKISPDGNKIALTTSFGIFYGTFNNSNGEFDFGDNYLDSNTNVNFNIGYGVEFSPDSTVLFYSNGFGIMAMDLDDVNNPPPPVQIINSDFNLISLQLARNGRIYFTNGGSLLSVINNPNDINDLQIAITNINSSNVLSLPQLVHQQSNTNTTIIAKDDVINVNSCVGASISVLQDNSNGTDTLNNNSITNLSGNATLSIVGAITPLPLLGSITLNPTTGIINVAQGTSPGTYTIRYRLCTLGNCPTCSNEAVVTINVTATAINLNTIDAINDDFTIFPIESNIGGTTPSVYVNDLYNNTSTSIASLQNVAFSLNSPISIIGATINNYGQISIPPDTLPGIYTLYYNLISFDNCGNSVSDTATVQILISASITPQIFPGVRTNGPVLRIGQQSTGKILITGIFSTYNNLYAPMIARLKTDLTLDQNFQTIAPHHVPNDIAIQSDDKILMVANYNENGVYVNKFVRLLPDGGFDVPFNNNVGIAKHPLESGYTLHAIAIQNDGRILLGGMFYYYNGSVRNSIVRIFPDGTIDPSFNPIQLNDSNGYKRNVVHRITIQPDGRILLIGYFNFNNGYKQLIRLRDDGSLDDTFLQGTYYDTNIPHYLAFNADHTNGFSKTLVQPDGRIILVGAFSIYNGNSNIKKITRLLDDGTIDPSFRNNEINTTLNNLQTSVRDVILEPVTNKLIIGGYFSKYGNTTINKLIRLNDDGSLDSTFNIGTGITNSMPYSGSLMYDSYIGVLKQQPDGKIIVGGNFTSFNGLSADNITRIYGSAGAQARSGAEVYQSEPEIDLSSKYRDILIYPNPVNDILNIKTDTKIELVEVYNLQGQIIMQSNSSQINMSELTSGIYLIKITDENNLTVTRKVIKK